MRILFGDESTDFARYMFPDEMIFVERAAAIIQYLGLEEVERQQKHVTALLPLPRSNAAYSIAYAFGSIPWITFADSAEFRQDELTRYFLCYPPAVLIGTHQTLLSAQNLSPQCYLKLEATLCTDGAVKIGTAETYRWDVTIGTNGIEQVLTHVE